MRDCGFGSLFQLEGGILAYLQQAGPKHFDGECYVFDDRVSLDRELKETGTVCCHACRSPVTEAERRATGFVQGEGECVHCAGVKQWREEERRHEAAAGAEERSRREAAKRAAKEAKAREAKAKRAQVEAQAGEKAKARAEARASAAAAAAAAVAAAAEDGEPEAKRSRGEACASTAAK